MSVNSAGFTTYRTKSVKRNLSDYQDILDAKRPQTTKHPMSTDQRAAQFAPYAALVGHKDIIAADEAIATQKTDLDQEIIIEYNELF